ncbi:MAG TPA: transposase [Granulicella sp.]|jgi:putative transposase|nr:transposase [Granulicella sp.]
MSKATRSSRPGIAFVTLTTRDRRPVFEISRVADLFVDTLLHYRTLGHYKLHAYVVLPDHIHLMITPQSITLDQAIELIKNGFTYRLDSALPTWQNGFTGYSVANLRDLEVVRAFIHQLPVRAHLAPAAELYRHSSAYRQNLAAAPLTAITGGRTIFPPVPAILPQQLQEDPPRLKVVTATSPRQRAS